MTTVDSRSALITGAAGAIGTATARLLAGKGYACTLADRDEMALVRLAESLPGTVHFCGDLTDPETVARLFGNAPADLSAVVLAVGGEGPVGALEHCEDAHFQALLALNVTSTWLGLKHALRTLKPKGGGSIVVLSSISGLMGMPMMSAYAATKHAVMGLVRSAAREAAMSGVRVNAVCPGPTSSALMRRVDDALGRQDAAHSIPMGRYAKTDEVAQMVAFLCSDESRYSTGASFTLDGGYSCR